MAGQVRVLLGVLSYNKYTGWLLINIKLWTVVTSRASLVGNTNVCRERSHKRNLISISSMQFWKFFLKVIYVPYSNHIRIFILKKWNLCGENATLFLSKKFSIFRYKPKPSKAMLRDPTRQFQRFEIMLRQSFPPQIRKTLLNIDSCRTIPSAENKQHFWHL